MRKALLKLIDFFYPPFSKYISLHTFRYIASGGTTFVAGIVIYYIAYNWILQQQDVHLDFPMLPKLITAPVAALCIESVITFFIGFTLNKYLVFTKSTLKGRIQLFRYASVVATNILINYALLKVLVEAFGFYPTVSKIIISLLLAVFSYFSQKHFSFKVKK
ncbi:GtrA family protein [Pedobacter gandavensis]|uniref:GtrA family protein n=1 Tax=Pedobacter gandavensis TaxID=2679963 RepID=UPI002931608B|nr:GtrA family protein [Pedobacter gandavensis]